MHIQTIANELSNDANDIASRMDARARALTPSDILTGTVFTLDAADVVVASGKVSQFNNNGGAPIVQSTDARRAAYIASDPEFNGQPSALFFAGPGPGAADWNEYPLPVPDASAREAEAFLVLRSTYGNSAPNPYQSGLWSVSNNNTHYAYAGMIYDVFYSNVSHFGFPPPAGVSITTAHIYNPRSSAAGHHARMNDKPAYDSNVDTFSATYYVGRFGAGNSTVNFCGKLAYMVLCNRVQSPEARAAMHAYLAARFGITLV